MGAQRAPFLDEWLWSPSAQGRQLLQSTAGTAALYALVLGDGTPLLAWAMMRSAPSPAYTYKVAGTVFLLFSLDSFFALHHLKRILGLGPGL
jgi:hypothetical protein